MNACLWNMSFLSALIAWLVSVPTVLLAQLPNNFSPPACAVTEDGQTAYIIHAGKLQRISAEALSEETPALELVAQTIADPVLDMAICEATQELIAVCDQPPRLIRQPLAGGSIKSTPLPATPARIALTPARDGKQTACVSLPWSGSIWIGQLTGDSEMEGSTHLLGYPVREVIAMDEDRFLVADALRNRLALVNAVSRETINTYSFPGHHFAGLAFDSQSKKVFVTHQMLSSNARTDRDDIRWGNLIQNNVAEIPLAKFSQSSRLSVDNIIRLGEFGHGASDPAGVVAMGERIAVALAGTNQVALYSRKQHQAKFVTVGRVPQRLMLMQGDRLLCLHRSDSRIAVINARGEVPELQCMLGDERPIAGAEQRGELAYFSGQLSHEGWMSCNSCHVEGQSPDLLVDTLGDATFDTPKKIPSLQQTSQTGPWAWNGGALTLHDQLNKTLTNTMHVPDELPASTGLDRESVVADLVAYLSSLKAREPASTSEPLTTEASDKLAEGEAVFQEHCARCHDPANHFTTAKSYDVGLNDERGQKLFNPPSLRELRFRAQFMHDGRFRSLDQVLQHHPDPTRPIPASQREQLIQYLKSL